VHSNCASASKSGKLVTKAQQVPQLRINGAIPDNKILYTLYHGTVPVPDGEENLLTAEEFKVIDVLSKRANFTRLNDDARFHLVMDQESWEALTVAQKKKVLRSKGAKESGNKAELVQRLLSWKPMTTQQISQKMRSLILKGQAMRPLKDKGRSARKAGQKNEGFIVEAVSEVIANRQLSGVGGADDVEFQPETVETYETGLGMRRDQPELRASPDGIIVARLWAEEQAAAVDADEKGVGPEAVHCVEVKTAAEV
jgi:hypothetical protein